MAKAEEAKVEEAKVEEAKVEDKTEAAAAPKVEAVAGESQPAVAAAATPVPKEKEKKAGCFAGLFRSPKKDASVSKKKAPAAEPSSPYAGITTQCPTMISHFASSVAAEAAGNGGDKAAACKALVQSVVEQPTPLTLAPPSPTPTASTSEATVEVSEQAKPVAVEKASPHGAMQALQSLRRRACLLASDRTSSR